MPRTTSAAHEATRNRLLEAAGRAFRRHGYGGVGVDAVAAEANVTSGAFYSHFGSKAAIFRSSLERGLDGFRRSIAASREAGGPGWLRRYARWYLNSERRADLANSCALPVLSVETARADAETRELYDRQLRAILSEIAAGLPPHRGRERDAIVVAALLAGGMSMAHAVSDRALSDRIARVIAAAIGDIEKVE